MPPSALAEPQQTEERRTAGTNARLRPRDAATLILLDRRGGAISVLMGRRHSKHVFMAGRFVFPGGRTDPADARIPVAAPLHPAEAAKLRIAGMSESRARAIAMSAIRETYEEAGLLIGYKTPFVTRSPAWQAFSDSGVQPALDSLRYFGRAITPPGNIRRYDTRFFAVWREAVSAELPAPTDELEEQVWVPLSKARELNIPDITQTLIGDLERRLADDPELKPGACPVPCYCVRHRRFVRETV